MARDGGKTGGRRAKAPRPKKGLRKHLRRLERQVASAAQLEAKRVRKLEKARYRRQRLEALIEEVRLTAELAGQDAAPVKAPAPTPGRGASRPAPAARATPPAAKAAARAAKASAPPKAKAPAT